MEISSINGSRDRLASTTVMANTTIQVGDGGSIFSAQNCDACWLESVGFYIVQFHGSKLVWLRMAKHTHKHIIWVLLAVSNYRNSLDTERDLAIASSRVTFKHTHTQPNDNEAQKWTELCAQAATWVPLWTAPMGRHQASPVLFSFPIFFFLSFLSLFFSSALL